MKIGRMRSEYVYFVITALLWSAVPAIAKLGLGEFDSLQVLFYNHIIAFITLGIVIRVQRKQQVFAKYTQSDYFKMASLGVLGFFVYLLLLYASFDHAPAGQANMLNYLWPIFTVLFSVPILREKITTWTILALLTSFVGAAFVFTQGNVVSYTGQYATGYAFAIAAGLTYGVFSVFEKKYRYEKLTSLFVYYGVSLVLIIPTTLVFSRVVLPTSVATVLALLFLGAASNSLGYVAWFRAMEKGNTQVMANLIYGVPFVSLIFVYFVNGEIVPPLSFAGLVLIVVGIFLQMRARRSG